MLMIMHAEHERALRPTAALLTTHLAVSAAIESCAVAATPHDATTQDLLLRIALSPEGRVRGVELCRQLHLSPSYVSRRIDRAEADGLVRRTADPDDRRAQAVVLTDAGRAAADVFVQHLVGVVDRVVWQTLDAEEADQLVNLLARIEHAARNVATECAATMS